MDEPKMRRQGRRPARGYRVAAAVLALGCVASACGSSHPAAGTGKHSGTVNVLYAASLLDLMNQQVAPGFHTATGYTFAGFPAGSDALAAQIKGKVRRGDVFISADPTVNASLTGWANGGWVSWYATFATSRLVLGYNPHSKFAAQLRSRPWYRVVTEPGFLLGRTDPAIDPKGVLAERALDSTAARLHDPALRKLTTESSEVFPEESLVGRLQAGQLDAGFFYLAEAKAAKIPTVPLSGTDLSGAYTVTVLAHAPDPAGAVAFVRYLLGSQARPALHKDGFVVISPPRLTGHGVPAALRHLLAPS